MIEHLGRVVPEPADPRPNLHFAEQMQRLTREIAFSPTGWTASRKREVTELFDRLASDWRRGVSETRDDALEDALARGGLDRTGLAVDVGSGTGVFTRRLASYFERLVVVDLSLEMLTRAPSMAPRVCADASELPFADRAVNIVVISNCFLFPPEVERVLAPNGALLWISVFGDRTPIYLSADEILEALPARWTARIADAGWGSWMVFRRTG